MFQSLLQFAIGSIPLSKIPTSYLDINPSLERDEDNKIMPNKSKKPQIKREYPPFWEKFIPVALIVITGIVVFLLIVIICVALGIFPFMK